MRTFTTLLLVLTTIACGQPDTTITRLTPDLSVAPDTFDFGDVVRDFRVEKSVQIVNTGRATLEVAQITLSNENAGFAIVDAEPMDLGPHESITLSIEFSPTDLGSFGTSLVIESNDEEAPIAEFSITGAGVIGPQPDIEITVATIDFGDGATVGVPTSPEYVIVRNIGDGPLVISDTEQSGSGAFIVTASPTAGEEIASGSESVVAVTYTPDGVLTGHQGQLVFHSNDPDEPEVAITLLGGDGQAYDYPVAIIEGTTSTHPPKDLILDGSNSSDPMDLNDEYELSFAWTVIDQPTDSNARFDDEGAMAPSLLVDIAGTFTVQLIVTDFNGVASAPAVHTIEAKPVEDLYIAVSWNKNLADVDLHVVPTGRTFFSRKDASFCNTSPSWGTDGHGEHSGDVSDGLGPESVEIGDISDTEYHIGVHYFEDNGGSVTTATVTIYVEGEPHETVSRLLGHNDFWEVGYMHVQNGIPGFVDAEVSTYSSDIRECQD
jgi:hypothetical protein